VASRLNRATNMIRRVLAPTIAISLGILVGSCSSFSGYVADHWPHWAGGEPEDVPPRPGAPGYDEFIAHGQSNQSSQTNKDATAPAAVPVADQTNVKASSSPAPAAETTAAVQGGLY